MKKKAKHRNRSLRRHTGHECVIPPPIPKHILKSYTMLVPRNKSEVAEYVEWQAKGEIVQHAEKVRTEHIMDRAIQSWDVYTDRNRYWVMTAPTNLYDQKIFPSLDYTLSFHIGLFIRVSESQKGAPSPEHRGRFLQIWRRWDEAAKALDQAEEAEDFQTVGMRCRECLIHLARSIFKPEMLASGQAVPKRSDFVGMSTAVSNTIARGGGAEQTRAYLKAIAKTTWDLSQWLTHAQHVSRSETGIVLDATQSVIIAFGQVAIRFESGRPDRCPKCGSYKIGHGYSPGATGQPYFLHCEKCGWKNIEGYWKSDTDT
jgi:predicted RNA-binding Zn-ribbon protein involved in translation (DUF1610 family)